MRFEDLKAWQKAREMTNAVYRLCRTGELARDFGLRDQIQRAAVSAMNNTAEGFERVGQAEKRHFYNMAKASAGEVKSMCYVIADNGLAPAEQTLQVQGVAAETCALLHGLIRSSS